MINRSDLGAERTSQRAVREVELRDVVPKLTNIRWQCETRVAVQTRLAPIFLEVRDNSVCLHTNDLKG